MDGTFYTWKLAVHYFRKQPDTDDRDRCFIMTGSMVAYIDSPVNIPSATSLIYSFLQVIPQLIMGSGKLGIHSDQVWPPRLHEDRASKQLGTRNPNQLCRAMLDQKRYPHEGVRRLADRARCRVRRTSRLRRCDDADRLR